MSSMSAVMLGQLKKIKEQAIKETNDTKTNDTQATNKSDKNER